MFKTFTIIAAWIYISACLINNLGWQLGGCIVAMFFMLLSQIENLNA
jgi:putative effector of murein hydrolase LrgA (UPF0299 family)